MGVPAQFHHGPFIIGALDNLDYKPSSTTAVGSVHGTGVSLLQFPTVSNYGIKQADFVLPSVDSKTLELPMSYSIVPAIAMYKTKVEVLKLSNVSDPIEGH